MSNEGERTCPLCAEEMDLTDQQLKPCKCGYEICVWCWHHIMDMAEKDDTEGRCPACRSPYDKEKIVGMAAKCERLVTEINQERKMKNQKAKPKSSNGQKQLSSVRVIQRNLVYIVGLPLNLADEDVLQGREYFGQYGKVLKVSMSQTAAGVIQQFPNETCSVYITYSKEEEAIRCIQNVHGFVLDGRPLRACFGTTKYCHAWLRNMPCGNPDCLYLHEIGSQEDSFTKDEIISAYTRSRVQQITGSGNHMQRRSGTVLPPPVDDSICSSSGKPIVKHASSNSASTVRSSPPNGRPLALPSGAAWGTQATNSQHPAGGISYSNGPSKPKSDTVSSTLAFSAAVASTIQASALHSVPPSSDGSHGPMPRVKNELLKPIKQYNSIDSLASGGEKSPASDVSPVPVNLNSQLPSISLFQDSDGSNCTSANTRNYTDIAVESYSSDPEEAITATNEEIQNLSSELSFIKSNRIGHNEQYGISNPCSPPPDYVLIKSSKIQGSQYGADRFSDVIITDMAGKAATSDNGVYYPREQCSLRLDSESQVVSATAEVDDDITSFDNQRLKDPDFDCHSYLPKLTSALHASNQYVPCTAANDGTLSADVRAQDESLFHASSVIFGDHPEKLVSCSSYGLLGDGRNGKSFGRIVNEAVNADGDAAIDRCESSIISNILSMDFDVWDDSLTSPQNLAKFLGDNTDNRTDPLKKSSSWKVQSSNQSRFSFARQEDPKIQNFDVYPSYGVSQQHSKSLPLIQDFSESNLYMNKLAISNGFPTSDSLDAENLGNGHFIASDKLSAILRTQVSAPPGFSVPNRPPPPGFPSHDRMEKAFDSISGNSLHDHSSLLRNSYPTPSNGNIGGAGDIEFIDPAILAVGKGRLQGSLNSPALDMRSNLMPQLNYYENDAKLQLLMQRSLSQQQNLRFSAIGSSFSEPSDCYGISRLDQSQVSSLAPFPQLSLQHSRNAALSNGNWDEWNEVRSGSSLS